MARNPLILSTFGGLLWGLTGLHLPVPVDALLKLLSDSAAPCALFALGLTLVGRPLSHGLEQLTLTTIGKLAVHPLMVWMLAAWLWVSCWQRFCLREKAGRDRKSTRLNSSN